MPEPAEWNSMSVTVLANKEHPIVIINGQRVTLSIKMYHEKKAAAGVVVRRYHGYNGYFRGFDVKGKHAMSWERNLRYGKVRVFLKGCRFFKSNLPIVHIALSQKQFSVPKY